MNVFKLRIVRVDMNGYLGREHHPDPSDVGLVVTPLRMEVFHTDPAEGEMSDTIDAQDEARPTLVNDEENLTALWVTMTSDGRTLDLIDDEVELVSLQEA